MEAALRSARHDARLLGNHLKRSLGKGDEPLPESTARTATKLLLGQDDTHSNLDTEKALQLSRLAPRSATACSTVQYAAGNTMDVEGDGNTDAAVGSIGAETLPSGPGGQLDSTRAAPSHEVVGVNDESNHVAAASTTLEGGRAPASAAPVVDRRRLIAILAAEERTSAMANHLGSANPMTHLRSLLLPEQASSAPWFSRSCTGAPAGHRSQFGSMGSSSMVVCESAAAGEVLTNATATTNQPSEKSTGGLPRLSLDAQLGRGQGKPAQRKQWRSRSAEDYLLVNSKSDGWDDYFAEESNHGRKKRSREGEIADHSEESSGLGRVKSFQDDFARPRLARSSSISSNQPQKMTGPEAGVTGNSSFCSLPRLKASRLSW